MTSQPVRMKTKVAYGIGSSAEAAVHITFNTFNFLFYNNVLGLSGTLTGLAVTIALVFDAISDPLIGSISDRWHSKLGRRHPFLYAAPIPLGLCFFAIYSPPAGLTDLALFTWFTVFTILLRLALTLYHVPHLALGAELSDDYRERTVIMSYNSILGMVGGAAAFFFSWTWFSKVEGGTEVAANYLPVGAAVGIGAAVVVFASAHFTRDQIPKLVSAPEGLPRLTLKELVREILVCLRNRNYMWLLLGMLCLAATTGTRETMSAYVNLFFWELKPEQLRFFGLTTPLGFIVAFIITPRLHDRFDKRGTMVGSVGLLVTATTLPIVLRIFDLMPDNGASLLFPILATFVATFYCAAAVLTISVMSALADVSDEHELVSGRRQEGVFYSARTLLGKFTSGLGHLIGGIAIDLIEFPTGAKVGEVDPEIVFNLGVIDGPVAAIPSLFAIFFYARYKIDKQRLAEIQSQLAARASGKPDGEGAS